MTKLRKWVRLPSEWIVQGGLKDFRWSEDRGSTNAAALLVLACLAHAADDETGTVRLIYDRMQEATGLCRSKVSQGLRILQERQLISKISSRQSCYQLENYDPRAGWSKLPARGLYHDQSMYVFNDFRLRNPSELHALALYYLFAAFRDNTTNIATISYDKISEYTGIEKARIRTAISILAISGLVHVERVPSKQNDYGVANGYRLAHIEPYMHMGTRGRGLDAAEWADAVVTV